MREIKTDHEREISQVESETEKVMALRLTETDTQIAKPKLARCRTCTLAV